MSVRVIKVIYMRERTWRTPWKIFNCQL